MLIGLVKFMASNIWHIGYFLKNVCRMSYFWWLLFDKYDKAWITVLRVSIYCLKHTNCNYPLQRKSPRNTSRVKQLTHEVFDWNTSWTAAFIPLTWRNQCFTGWLHWFLFFCSINWLLVNVATPLTNGASSDYMAIAQVAWWEANDRHPNWTSIRLQRFADNCCLTYKCRQIVNILQELWVSLHWWDSAICLR